MPRQIFQVAVCASCWAALLYFGPPQATGASPANHSHDARQLAEAMKKLDSGEPKAALEIIGKIKNDAFACEARFVEAKCYGSLGRSVLALGVLEPVKTLRCPTPIRIATLELAVSLARRTKPPKRLALLLEEWLQLKSGQYDKAVRRASEGVTSLFIQKVLREDGEKLAKGLKEILSIEGTGKKRAEEIREILYLRYPQTEPGRTLDPRKLKKPTTDRQLYVRARILAAIGNLDGATRAFQSLGNRATDKEVWQESLLQVGKIMERRRQGAASKAALTTILKRVQPGSSTADKARYLLSRTYYRRISSKRHLALPLLEKLEGKGVERRLRGDAMRFRIGILLETRRVEEAIGLLQAEGDNAESLIRTWALEKLGWRQYRARNWKGALITYRKLLSAARSDSEKVTAMFWAGRSMEKLKRKSEAMRFLAAAAATYPFHYYGALAKARLPPKMKLPAPDGPKPRILGKYSREEIPESSAKKLKALRQQNLYQFAAWELLDVLERSPKNLAALYELARIRALEGEYEKSLYRANTGFGSLRYRGPAQVPAAILRLLYPLPYAGELRRLAAEAGVDAPLAAALIHQESGFFAQVVSASGAVGLMQLMPKTAAAAARELGYKLDKNSLFDPVVNLRLGLHELARSLRAFGGQVVPAIAGYNAGPTKARQWWRTIPHRDMDLFIERVPYSETRSYIKKILGKIEAYKMLYPTLSQPP